MLSGHQKHGGNDFKRWTAECLPRKLKGLSSIPRTKRNKIKDGQEA